MSGAIGAIVQTDQAAISTSTPAGILAIDTTTWEIVGRLDDSSYDSEASGLHVIDTTGLEVVVHHPAHPAEDYLGPVTFSLDGALACAASFGGVEASTWSRPRQGPILNHRENVRMLGQVAAVAGWSEG